MNQYIYPLLLVINSNLVFNTEHTFATKSGAHLPNCNRVGNCGQIDSTDIQKIKDFFHGIPFGWFVDSSDSNAISLLESSNFRYKKKVDFPAMQINLATVTAREYKDIQVKKVNSESELAIWIDIVLESFDIKLSPEFKKYIQYLTEHADQEALFFYLAYYQGVPAATSMVIKRDSIAALHWIGTIPKYRRQGLGYAITQSTLVDAKQNGCTDAVLFSSSVGAHLYERVGFTQYALYHIYVFNV